MGGRARAPVLPFLLFLAAGLISYSINRNLKFVFWDEFLWHPDVARLAREAIASRDWAALLHPTRWQYPPLFFWVDGALVGLLGESFAVFRLPSIVSSALLAPWAYLIGRAAGGERAGILAGLYALLLPLAHRYGSALLVDPLQAALVGAALLAFVRAETRGGSLFPAGTLAALAVSTKYTSLLLPAALLLVLLADRVRSGASVRRRAPIEIVLFAALSFFPLLLLREEDRALLRAMAFWRSLPFDWADLFRVVPAPLFVFALLAPLLRASFSRAMRGPVLFLALWLLFFFWGRRQMNWLLPAAVPLAALAGHATAVWVGGRRSLLAVSAAAAILLYGGYRSAREILIYRETERIYNEAAAYANERVSPDEIVVVDALPFESPLYLHSSTCNARFACYREGRLALLVPWVFENYKRRGFDGAAWGEVHEREIRETWRLEKRFLANGRPILEIYANPAFLPRSEKNGPPEAGP